tara:strand:+ start:897 stop:1829 length:933 start_codon:yes stop_codon:yes gene_type:complete
MTTIFRNRYYSIKNKLFMIKSAYNDHRNNKYIRYKQAIINLFRNRNLKYKTYTFKTVQNYKTSDTIFLLGSGPSLNWLDRDQIKHIKEKNSIGFNKSFMRNDLVPTFHQYGWEKGNYRKYEKIFSPFRGNYEGVINFVHTLFLGRLIHPLFTRTLFPKGLVKICIFKVPNPIYLSNERKSFRDDDFYESLSYRGTMSLGLDIVAYRLKYKKIVLVGVDLDTNSHFFDDDDLIKENKSFSVEKRNEYYDKKFGVKKGTAAFESMYSIPGKPISMDEYYVSVAEYLKREKDIELFIAFKNNILYPRLPAYFD